MARQALKTPSGTARKQGRMIGDEGATRGALIADIIIANAPDPVFVSDLEGKILQASCSGSAFVYTENRAAAPPLTLLAPWRLALRPARP